MENTKEQIKEEQNMIIKPTVDMTYEKDDTFDSQSTCKEDDLDTDETEDEEVKRTCLGKKFYTTSSDEDNTCDTEESEEYEDDKESKMDDNEDEDDEEVDEESTISTHSDSKSTYDDDDEDDDADGLDRDRSFHKTPPQKFTFDLNECEPGIIICKPKPIVLKKFQGTSYDNYHEDSSDHDADEEDYECDYDNDEEEQSHFDEDSDIAESECSESDCEEEEEEEESSVSSSSTSNYSDDKDEMQLEVEDVQGNIERSENEDDDESLEEEVSLDTKSTSSSNDIESEDDEGSEDESIQSSVESFVDQQDNSCVIESNDDDMEQNEIHFEWKEVIGDDELLYMETIAVSGSTTDSDASSIVAEELESIINSNNKEHMSFLRQGELTYCDDQDNFGFALSSKRSRENDGQVTDSKRRCTQLNSTSDGSTLDETGEGTQVLQQVLHDSPIQSDTIANIAQKPIPLLTPPITPCAIKSDESFVAICELPSDLVVDKSLPATIQLRALSPSSLVKLEDTNNYQGTIIQPRKVRSVTRDFSNAPQADTGLTSIIDTVVN